MPDWLSHADAGHGRWLNASLVVVLGCIAYWLVARSLRSFAKSGHMRPTMEGRLRGLLRLFALICVLMLVLQEAGAFSNAWAVLSAGLTAVAIGFFALWSVLSNAVCAVLLLVFRPFRIGDEIELPDAGHQIGVRGVVRDLNLLFVTLEEVRPDERKAELRVPNNLFFQRIVRRFDGKPDGSFETEGFFD